MSSTIAVYMKAKMFNIQTAEFRNCVSW